MPIVASAATFQTYGGHEKPCLPSLNLLKTSSKAKRWGNLEVQHMLTRLPDGGTPHYAGTPNGLADAKHDKAVRNYQQSKGLKLDGLAGPNTRKALITDYMAIDGTSLPAGATLTTHGCGEFFPVVGTPDGTRNAENRRVEIFFFDGRNGRHRPVHHLHREHGCDGVSKSRTP